MKSIHRLLLFLVTISTLWSSASQFSVPLEEYSNPDCTFIYVREAAVLDPDSSAMVSTGVHKYSIEEAVECALTCDSPAILKRAIEKGFTLKPSLIHSYLNSLKTQCQQAKKKYWQTMRTILAVGLSIGQIRAFGFVIDNARYIRHKHQLQDALITASAGNILLNGFFASMLLPITRHFYQVPNTSILQVLINQPNASELFDQKARCTMHEIVKNYCGRWSILENPEWYKERAREIAALQHAES